MALSYTEQYVETFPVLISMVGSVATGMDYTLDVWVRDAVEQTVLCIVQVLLHVTLYVA